MPKNCGGTPSPQLPNTVIDSIIDRSINTKTKRLISIKHRNANQVPDNKKICVKIGKYIEPVYEHFDRMIKDNTAKTILKLIRKETIEEEQGNFVYISLCAEKDVDTYKHKYRFMFDLINERIGFDFFSDEIWVDKKEMCNALFQLWNQISEEKENVQFSTNILRYPNIAPIVEIPGDNPDKYKERMSQIFVDGRKQHITPLVIDVYKKLSDQICKLEKPTVTVIDQLVTEAEKKLKPRSFIRTNIYKFILLDLWSTKKYSQKLYDRVGRLTKGLYSLKDELLPNIPLDKVMDPSDQTLPNRIATIKQQQPYFR